MEVVGQDKFKKYRHLGIVYPEVSSAWKPIILEMLEELDKVLTPKWIPRFLLNIITNLAFKKSGEVRYKLFYNIYKKLGIKGEIQQIKSKFANLKVSGTIPSEFIYIIQNAEIACDLTCEKCGSTNQTRQVVVNRWVTNLCKECRERKNDNN